MSTISPTDNLFATAYMRGIEIYRFAGTGISSLSELISKMRDHAAGCGGMVTLNVRNSSRGWAGSKSIYLSQAS